MLFRTFLFVSAALAIISTPALAEPWKVKQEWVSSHASFLASEALQGRTSATRDEAIAAAYIAAQFEAFGLKPAPGMTSYIQTAAIDHPELDGKARLTAGGVDVAEGQGLTLYYSHGQTITGKIAVARSSDPAVMPDGDILVITPDAKFTLGAWWRAAMQKGVKLLIVRESDDTKKRMEGIGGETIVPARLVERPVEKPRADVAFVAVDAFDTLAKGDGQDITFTVGQVKKPQQITSNAIGWLQGLDPNAGVILISAHLDAVGAHDGKVVLGANDDASGVAAVLELARALSAAGQPRRSVMFVAYGAEEIGLLGSQYFAMKPPVPLESIVANLEIEMIGQQDPKMPAGVMMMTGFDRSDFGESLKAKGALIAPDLYPEQNFFERSDNYQLALQGIVAHTLSGWAVTPTYHTPDDTIANLNLPFMTQAIQSLVEPVTWLANGDYVPKWKDGGKPK
ncbi:M28 family metallopeptidase [Asticcacaulis sp. AC402]|uniref:M28 family metallopeptidase n=1 Tax=Asticcacaulis sp. AC402 TaxID=1282361 RepID=UPI0003C3B32A|nr:M20/M25/M40 family metallo-hydrolase [Asticcacaulis sp. AC402]ESQ73569.1 hypothetical protein ABAC402_18570 [Asticcacaulis sp. AC402]